MYTMYTFLHIYLNFILYDRLQDASEVTSLPHSLKVQRWSPCHRLSVPYGTRD